MVIASTAFFGAGLLGIGVALMATPLLLALGFAAALISILYSMPPAHLSYRGLGAGSVPRLWPGIVLGSVLLFEGHINGEVILAGILIGLLIAVVLLMNELPDERADRGAGKKTSSGDWDEIARPRSSALSSSWRCSPHT